MTGKQFKTEIRDSDAWITPYNTEIALSISCDYEHTGYDVVQGDGILFPNDDGEETYISVEYVLVEVPDFDDELRSKVEFLQ